MSPACYLRLTLVATLGVCATALAVNWHLDPLALREAGELGSQPSAERPFSGEPFLRKAFAVTRVKPASVILGTSRAEFGLDRGHAGFTDEARPTYNLALAGVTIAQLRELLVHAQATRPLRIAVIGLDMESFLPGGRTDFDRAVLASNPESVPQWMNISRLNLSWRALNASFRLLVPAPDAWQPQDVRIGQRELIQLKEFDNFHSRLPQLFPGPDREQWMGDPHRAAAMRDFEQLLAYARTQQIDLRLFISPVHARYLELYRRVGWWPLFESWKRALVGTLAKEDAEAPGSAPFQLLDFSGFNELTMEAVPSAADPTTRMRWYRDSSHYSREHGSLILDRVLYGAQVPGRTVAAAVRLDTENIEAHLSRIRQDANSYRVTRQAEVAELGATAGLLRRFVRKRP